MARVVKSEMRSVREWMASAASLGGGVLDLRALVGRDLCKENECGGHTLAS